MAAKRRTILVSGAARGIGRAIAEAFARSGDHVVIADIDDDEGRAVAAGIVAQAGSAEYRRVDVARWDDIGEFMSETARRHVSIDVAVANAGIARRVTAEELNEAAWDRLVDINLKGTAQWLLSAAKTMQSGASLIAVSSISAISGWPEHVHYNASKAGIGGLVRGLAAELGPKGIRVNCILPGVIRTAQSLSVEHSLGDPGLEQARTRIPLRRVGTPADVADVAVFLASAAARYITGQSIIVDGGLSVANY